MSHRSQIAYLSIAKIKIICENNIFTFCLRTAEDVGPYRFRYKFYVSVTDGCVAITDFFGMGNPSPTAVIHFSFVGEAFRLPLFDLHHCSVSDFVRTQISKLPKGILLRVISNPTPTPTGSFLIFKSARPADDEADSKIGKNKEYQAGATRSRLRRLCF